MEAAVLTVEQHFLKRNNNTGENRGDHKVSWPLLPWQLLNDSLKLKYCQAEESKIGESQCSKFIFIRHQNWFNTVYDTSQMKNLKFHCSNKAS